MLKLVGLADRIQHLPSELSGGQQQRVAIARALINRPHVLLADEPTGNLDSATSEEILREFQHLNHEMQQTIILVTHETSIADWASRLLTVRDGRIAADETVHPDGDGAPRRGRASPADVARAALPIA